MKLSLKLRPTTDSALISNDSQLAIYKEKILGGEDGESNLKAKSSEDSAAENVSESGDFSDTTQIDNNNNTQSDSSRSSSPEAQPIIEVSSPPPPLLLPPPPPPPPKDDEDIELMAPKMADISKMINPELSRTPEEDDEEEDMVSSDRATEEETPLDFSIKARSTEDESTSDDDRSQTPNGISEDGPLDLSVPRRRSSGKNGNPRPAKIPKLESALSVPSSPWGYNAPKHSSLKSNTLVKASVAEVPMWNGKLKSEKKGEKVSSKYHHNSLNRSTVYNQLLQKNAISPPLDTNSKMSSKVVASGNIKSDPYRPAGRQNPWQSQWMSRSSEQTRDVFTCVWCKESFRNLADMTLHMKQSPRCGMAGMQNTMTPSTSIAPSPSMNHQAVPHHSSMSSKNPASSSTAGPTGAGNAVIKENVSLPRKLVRGQDVWLGKGAEQTRQILKCMWCGQSFKTLADMTTHMRVTQHYTNIISQEQIISWRTPEDKMAAQSQVNAVLTCKVCDQAFGSLKELSYHMVKNSHYKEHILRSITEGGGRRRQTRERRKKSLPVRKLLELERLELNKQNPESSDEIANQTKNEVVDGKISCEECTEKVDAKDFVQHIKNCAQGSRSQHSVKSSPSSEGGKSTGSVDTNPDIPTTSGTGGQRNSSPLSSQEILQSDSNAKGSGGHVLQEDNVCDSAESAGSTSVLNAIEKLIEKSFESKGRRNTVSTGILQRLGIDEEVYPPWHPSSSPSAFGVLRSTMDLQRKSTSPMSRLQDYKMEMADFSGSESRSRSSSISEKHPSFDEHLRLTFGLTAKDVMNRVSTPSSASRSSSPVHFQPDSPGADRNAVFLGKDPNAATTSQANTPAYHSPRPRSTTPSSDRDASEKNFSKDHEESPAKEMVGFNDADIDREKRPSASINETAERLTRSREPTPMSEDRRTPISRGSSCEPEVAVSSTIPAPEIVAPVRAESPVKHSRSTPKKRKSADSGRKQSSSRKRRSSRKEADSRNDETGSPSSSVASPRGKQQDAGDHPLKELQKLLDKTDAHLSRPSLPAAPGSILAFSWACNEAATQDSLMKCAFCDTHFISKGAYRHHLSKMHFVKDGNLAEIAAASTWKPPSAAASSSKSPSGSNSNGCAASSSGTNRGGGDHPVSPQKDSVPVANPADESPHSKFLKYTELAKQLSSKYV